MTIDGPYQVSLPGASRSVGSLTLTGGAVLKVEGVLNAGHVSVGDSEIASLPTFADGLLDYHGMVVASGGIEFSGQSFAIADGLVLENDGTAVVQSSPIFGVRSPNFLNQPVPRCRFDNAAGGQIEFDGDSTIASQSSSDIAFTNEGHVDVFGDALHGSSISGLVNTGSISVHSGTLDLRETGTLGGSTTIEGGAIVSVGGNLRSYTLPTGAVITGDGSLRVTAGGTIHVAGTSSASNLILEPNGMITGPGTLTSHGTFNWTGGTLLAPGRLDALGGALISGASTKFGSDFDLRLSAATIWAGTGPISGGTVEIMPGAVFGVAGSETFQFGSLRIAGNLTIVLGGTLDFDTTTVTLLAGASGGGGGVARFVKSSNMLDVEGDASFPSVLLATNSTITGPGTVDITGTMTWTGGAMTGTGKTRTSNLIIDGAADKELRRDLVSLGTATWSSSGPILANGDGTIDNMAGAVFTRQSSNAFQEDLSRPTVSRSTFNNFGTLKAPVGTGGTAFQNATLTNSGQIDVAAGVTLGLRGGLFNLLDGSTITGDGLVSATLVTMAVAGTSTATNLTVASSTIGGQGTLSATNLTFAYLSNTAITGPLTLTGTTTLAGGITLDHTTLKNAGTFVWSGVLGTKAPTDSLVNLAGGVISLTTAVSGGFGVNLVNEGTILKDSPGTTEFNGFKVDNRGLIDVKSGTLFARIGTLLNASLGTLTGGKYLVEGSGNLTFGDNVTKNAADITISGPSALPYAFDHVTTNAAGGSITIRGGRSESRGSPLVNAGTISIETGSRLTAPTFSQIEGVTDLIGGTLSSPKPVEISGGTLLGNGTVSGDLVNSATVEPGSDGVAGQIDVTGKYTQNASGALVVFLGGTTFGVNYGKLQSGGIAFEGGTLSVGLVNGYRPSPGDIFQVLLGSATSGAFASFNGLDLGGGLSLQPSDGGFAVLLKATQDTVTRLLLDWSVASPTYGQSETFRLDVLPFAAGSPTPTGNVQFYDRGQPIGRPVSLVNGVAFSDAIRLGAGQHLIDATYSGDDHFALHNKTATLVVAPAHLTVIADPKSRIFGQSNPPPTYQLVGFLPGEDATSAGVRGTPLLSTTATVESPPGSYPIFVAIGSLSAPNYDFPNLVGSSLTVGQGNVNIKLINSINSFMYGQGFSFLATVALSNPVGSIQFTIDGSNLGRAVGLTDGRALSAYLSTLGAGTHTIEAVYIGDPNYSGSTTLVQAVSKARLQIGVEDQSRPLGAANLPFVYHIGGFIPGDHEATANITGNPIISTTATPSSHAGVYPITVASGSLSATNYDFSPVVTNVGRIYVLPGDATFTILKSEASSTYGQSVRFDATIIPLGTGLPVVGQIKFAIDGISTGTLVPIVDGQASISLANLGVGIHFISASLISPYPDYPLNGRSTTLAVGKASLSLLADDKTMNHGDILPTLTSHFAGFVLGEDAASANIEASISLSTPATSMSGAGRYRIVPTVNSFVAANYSLDGLTNGTLTVKPKVVDVRALYGSQSISLMDLPRDLPFLNINAVEVIFSDVMDVSTTTATLTGMNLGAYTLTRSDYDRWTNSVTWTLSAPIALDRLKLTVGGSVLPASTNTTSTIAADPFTTNFSVLPGDINGDGVVSTADAVLARNAISQPYIARDDVNGDGIVDASDVNEVRKRVGLRLP